MAQLNDPNNLYSRLRISNPLNFNQPTEQELFNRQLQENAPLQKELETRLDSVYRLSPNSEADSNIVDSAAVFMDLFGMGHEQALGLARTTFSAGLTKEARERMGFGQALGQTALNTFNQFAAGTNMALYMIGGNDEHKTKALEKQGKIVNLWEDYGFLGNTVLSSVQPLGSSLRYMGTTALLRGGSALLARAIGVSHPILATATFIAGTGLSFLANISITGLSQAGSDFLEYSQMADKNGTKLDLESPEAKTLFWTSALAHGTIESIGSELLPGVRYLNKTIDSVARNAILKESWKQVLMRVALGTPVGIIGEGFEEFLAVYNTALTENSLKYLANKEGASFDYTSGREMATEGWKAFTDGAVSMIIPSILTGALGGGVYNARTKAAARANFNKTEGSVSIDRRYIEDVPKPTAPKEGEIQKSTAEREKLDPVKLVDVGGTTPKLVALNAAEREKLGEAAERNAEAVEAVIVDQEPLSVEDRQSLVNRAALATGGKLSGDRIVYETSEDFEMAKVLLDPVSIQGDTVTFRDEDGALVSLELAVAEEGMDVTEADISYYEDPEAPHSLARMTQDKALEYQERKLIKEAIGNVVEHTGGRISNADLEANVDAVKMVAETLNIPTDELLGKGVAFRLVDMVRDAEGNEVNARGSIESNISIEGQKQYTINISKTADATTILHELGHTLRGLATEEQIRDFRLFYGKGKEAAFVGDINKVGDKFYVGEQAFDTLEQAQKLVEANEEAFANDFVAYLRTGQAPTADLRNIFARMKAVLNRFLAEFGYRLDPAVRQAFDNLLGRTGEALHTTGMIPSDAEGNVLFQESEVLFQILPDFYDPKKKLEIDGIVFDNDTGKGAVGNQYDANYYGFTATMAASDFLRIASPLTEYQKQDIKPKIEGVIALPFLEVEWDDNKKRWIVYGHEGRHRVSSIINEKGADFELPVNLLTYKWRGERLTPEMVKAPFVSQMGDYLINPRGTRYLRGEKVADGFTGEKTTIRYLRQKTEKSAEPVKNLDDYTPSPEVTEMIDWLRSEGVLFQLAPPIDSEAFKAWFGNSVIVNEDGSPKIMFHGPSTVFTEFKRPPFFFTDDREIAYLVSYERDQSEFKGREDEASDAVMEVYLKIEHPLDVSNGLKEKDRHFIDSIRKIINYRFDDQIAEIRGATGDTDFDPIDAFLNGDQDLKYGNTKIQYAILELANDNGYDGVIFKDQWFSTNDISYVAFSPTQIKSVNNQGTWGAGNPNIYFQQAPPVDSAAFKAWFVDSKALDKNGDPLIVYHGTPSKVPIEVFDESEDGYWFTDSNKLAEQFTHRRDLWTSRDSGHVEAVYLRLLNPLDIDAAGSTWDNIANTPLQGNGEWKPKAFGNLPNNAVSASDVVAYAKANGYDGIVFHDLRDSVNSYIYGNVKSTNYVVFDREQIKSVNNQGAWDTESINILFQKVPPVGSEEYKQLFDESKAVDKQGRPLTLYHGSTFTGILEFDNTGIYKAHGGESGYVYATDDYDTANEFSYEQLPGKSNLTYIQGARGQVYPVHMSIKHPLDFRNLTSNDFENMKDATNKYSSNAKILSTVFDDAKAGGEYAQAFLRQTARDLVEHLAEYGYDGLISEMRNGGPLEYAAISSGQVVMAPTQSTLYQLSHEAKHQLLEERKKDVQDAIENHFWVSSRILEEYLDEEWAQKEMATREYLNQFPWMLEEARQFATPEEYLQFIETMSEDAIEKGEQYKLTPEDADWYRKIFAYARIQSPQDLDKQFVDNFTKDKKSIAQLARAIKTYQDIGNRKVSRHTKLKENSRIVVWKWGTFKGVSPYVKNFTEKSSDEDFERAKKLIQENPRAYRKALRIVNDAEERVMAFKTHSSTSSYGYSREAYYDDLDEDMLAALDEPLLLSEMTDREAAEYLRTTSNKQERFNAREKLATHMGVYAMELQADAEVKRLGEVKDSEIKKLKKQRERLANELKETGEQFKKARKDLRSAESALEKERARSWELVEKLDEKSKQASKVNQLEKDLADRRARVKELRTQLTEKSREARRLNRQVTAYENREEARKTREKIERLMKVAYVAIKVSPSMDASYHPVFGWVQERLGLTSEYSKPDAPWKKKVDMLEDYLPRDVLDMLSAGIQIDQWPVEALQALVDGMRMLQRQARIEGAYRADQTRMRRDRIALEYDRQTYGYTPMETDQSIESVMGEIRDRLDNRKQNFYNGKEGKAEKVAHVFRQSFAHIWSFSTWLDGQKENGIMFKMFARTVWEYYQEEFRNVQRRLSAFDDIRKQMGYNQERLAKKVFSYTTPGGNEVALNLEQAITAYIYSLNEKGLKKLIHASGNGMSHAILADLYQVLSEEDRQFAQAMIDAAGGDAEYMRLAEVFYRVYNHDLSREQNYFRFRAAGVEMENDIDLAKGIRKERFSYVEKGFGEDRTEAIYPLNLNGMKNLTKTIEEQEHLIHFGEWVRDANYLLGPKGSLGHEVRVTYGDTSLKTLQTFVKRIAGAQDTISDFEKMLNNLITQVSSSLISANLSSMMKQAASMSYVLMGDISLPHAVRCMCWWSPTPEIRNWVHAYEVMCELDPSMKERTFDIEVKRSRNLEYTTKASRALAKIRDTGIKYTTQLGDSLITVKMWWGAYLTGLDKFANMEEAGRMREAVFYASRFIAETQSSSNPMDLAEIQTSRHTWQRLISAFKRDAFKRWNLAFYKLPQAVRNRQWAKAGGIITSQLLGLLILAGVRGLFIKKDDDDDEKYRKFLMKNLTAQLFEESIPYAGEGIASGILGFGGGDLLELDDVSGRWLGEFFDGDKDWDAFWKRSWELAITSLSTVGVPSLAVERTIKSVDETNFWRLIGGYWYKLGEDD